MKEKSKSNVPLIVLLCSTALALIGAGTALGVKNYQDAHAEKEIDESQLLIGIPAKQDERDVSLMVHVKSANGVKSMEYPSSQLSKLEGQDSSVVFLDYGASPLIDLNGSSIGSWLADPQNVITVNTIAIDLIKSSDVIIDKSGLWFVNVAAADGQKVEATHQYCYTKGGK